MSDDINRQVLLDMKKRQEEKAKGKAKSSGATTQGSTKTKGKKED